MDRDFKSSGSSKIKRNCELKCRNWFVYIYGIGSGNFTSQELL